MPGQPDVGRRPGQRRRHAPERLRRQHAGPAARGRGLPWFTRPGAPARWLLCGLCRIAHRAGSAAGEEGLAVGVVTSIAAPAALRISVEGEGGHAGGVLMHDRKDAFCAAAEIVLAIEERALATGSVDTCATVGKCHVYPGAVNSIPSRVEMEADIRDTDEQRRNQVLREIEHACARVAARRNVQVQVTPINADAPATCAPQIIDAVVQAAAENGLAYKKMVSRAYHDSLFMARIAPVGMVFIPCRGGVSHRPDEYSAPPEIENGARVLAGALAKLSQVES